MMWLYRLVWWLPLRSMILIIVNVFFCFPINRNQQPVEWKQMYSSICPPMRVYFVFCLESIDLHDSRRKIAKLATQKPNNNPINVAIHREYIWVCAWPNAIRVLVSDGWYNTTCWICIYCELILRIKAHIRMCDHYPCSSVHIFGIPCIDDFLNWFWHTKAIRLNK